MIQERQGINSRFGIIGGDRRQLYLARSIAGDGYEVLVHGMEQAEDAFGLERVELPALVERCGIILLPLPASRDGVTLNAPYGREPIELSRLAPMLEGKRVFGGMLDRQKEDPPLWLTARDYYTSEELLTGNAFLTAEGAVALAVSEYPGTLGGSRCLVTGYGRIGKALCRMLQGMGAQVFCAARKPADRTAVRAAGCFPLEYREAAQPFDLIFNTVPAPVLGTGALCRQSRDALLMELASQPGGLDRAAADSLGLKILAAPSLPGRMSPKAAGELIKTTVYHMLEES